MYLQALKIFKGRRAHWCKATSMSETMLWSADVVVGAYLAGRPGYLPSFGSKVPAHPSLHSPCPPLVPTTGAHQPLFQTFHRSRQTANCPIEHFRKVISCPQNVQTRKAAFRLNENCKSTQSDILFLLWESTFLPTDRLLEIRKFILALRSLMVRACDWNPVQEHSIPVSPESQGPLW